MVVANVPGDSSLENVIDVIFHQAIVMSCPLAGIEINVGTQIVDERLKFYAWESSVKDLFLTSLIIDLYKRVSVTIEDYYSYKEYKMTLIL